MQNASPEILPMQLSLELPHRTALGSGDLFVSSSNELAVDWIDRWPSWPSHGLLVIGPAGCGKSHLTNVWQARTEAPRLTYADLPSSERIIAAHLNLAIEDIDVSLQDKACEEALFHAYNWTKERGGSLLMTAHSAPAGWDFCLPDLASRMKSVLMTEILLPDDSLLAALMLKLFNDRQLKVGSDVLLFLLTRMERSFSSAHRLVEVLDKASLAHRKNLTLPFVRRVLKQGKSS